MRYLHTMLRVRDLDAALDSARRLQVRPERRQIDVLDHLGDGVDVLEDVVQAHEGIAFHLTALEPLPLRWTDAGAGEVLPAL